MTLIITGTQKLDPDAAFYIDRVQAADGQSLEEGVKLAYSTFVSDCKTDGIWDAIKASCILAGARTTNGALVPLVGAAPDPYNFDLVGDSDYDRKTGLKGNGSTKYLDSNTNNNSLSQDDNSLGVFVDTAESSSDAAYIGIGSGSITGSNHIGTSTIGAFLFFRSMSANADTLLGAQSSTGFIGLDRSQSSQFTHRANGQSILVNQTSQTPATGNIYVFGRNVSDALDIPTDGRLQFYFIGESLDLAALDTRVTTLMSDLAAAIP